MIFFFQENTIENFCRMAAILSRSLHANQQSLLSEYSLVLQEVSAGGLDMLQSWLDWFMG